MPGHGLSGCGPAVGFPARSSSPMPYGSSSAAGDLGVARTGSRITRAMQPSAARGETSGPRPTRERGLAEFEQAPARSLVRLCRRRREWRCSNGSSRTLKAAARSIVRVSREHCGARSAAPWRRSVRSRHSRTSSRCPCSKFPPTSPSGGRQPPRDARSRDLARGKRFGVPGSLVGLIPHAALSVYSPLKCSACLPIASLRSLRRPGMRNTPGRVLAGSKSRPYSCADHANQVMTPHPGAMQTVASRRIELPTRRSHECPPMINLRTPSLRA